MKVIFNLIDPDWRYGSSTWHERAHCVMSRHHRGPNQAGESSNEAMKKILVGIAVLCATACGSDDSGSGTSGGAANSGAAGFGGGSASSCSAARAQLLGAVDSVSTSDVSLVSSQAGIVTLYVGATAGGTAAAAMNPFIFVSLEDSSKAELTDLSSLQSTAWDLALKRSILYTNGGDGGPGVGDAVLLDKEFEQVTAEDAVEAAFYREKFFDAECDPIVDLTGAAATSFSAWYAYDSETHALSPNPGTWLMHGATGKLFKLRIKSYYGTPAGGTGMAGGAYLLEVGAL
jgi:hypothetical protein